MEGSGKKNKKQTLISDEDEGAKIVAASTEGPTGLGFVVHTEKKKPGRKPKRDNDNNAAGDSEEEPAPSGLVKRSQGGYVKKQYQTHLPTPGLV